MVDTPVLVGDNCKIPQTAILFHREKSHMAVRRKAPPGWKWIFVKRYWHYRAKRYLYAENYGYEAWAFLVRA